MRGTIAIVPRSAMTLTDCLVVSGIIGILIGLILPAVQQVRGVAARVECQNRLRQVAIGLYGYHDTNMAFPVGLDAITHSARAGSLQGISWRTKILPFLDSQSLYEQTVLALTQVREPWRNPPNVGLSIVVPVFACPADTRLLNAHRGVDDGIVAAYSSFLGLEGSLGKEDGLFPVGRSVRLSEVTDGTSQTAMVGERPPSARLDSGWWYCPHPAFYTPQPAAHYYAHDSILRAAMYGHGAMRNCAPPPAAGFFAFGPGRIENQCDMYHFWSLHQGGANFAFADGSVHFLSYSTGRLLERLASRNGGEVIDLP